MAAANDPRFRCSAKFISASDTAATQKKMEEFFAAGTLRRGPSASTD